MAKNVKRYATIKYRNSHKDVPVQPVKAPKLPKGVKKNARN